MEERIPRKKFIRLGAAIGVSVAGASVVAGCGGGGGGSDSGTSSGGGATSTGGSGGSTETGSSGSSGGEAIAQASDVPQNSAQKFTNEGQPAVLVHLQSGDFVAYSAVCPHNQCTVAYQDGQLACPCHGSLFDPANGAEVLNGPAQEPLTEIPVQVQGGQVTKA